MGFDPAAKLIYAQNDQYHVLVYSMKNVKLKEHFPVGDSGEARQMVAHTRRAENSCWQQANGSFLSNCRPNKVIVRLMHLYALRD